MTNFSKKFSLAIRYPRVAYNFLADRIYPFRRGKFPRLIIFYATNNCNLNCDLCILSNYRQAKSAKNQDITLNMVERILPQLNKYKPMVYLAGGEPLLNKDIINIISLLARNGILTSMTTNGFLLKNFAEKIIDAKLEFLSISLDHYQQEIHNKTRGNPQSFQRLIAGLKSLIKKRKKYPVNIKINTVISQYNYDQLSSMFDFIESSGVDEWSLQHLAYFTPKALHASTEFKKAVGLETGLDGPVIESEIYFTDIEIEKLSQELEKIREKSNKTKMKVIIKPDTKALRSYYQGNFPSPDSTCAFLSYSIIIKGDHKVYQCLDHDIGDLNNNSLEEIFRCKKADWLRAQLNEKKVLPPCFRCCSLNIKFDSSPYSLQGAA